MSASSSLSSAGFFFLGVAFAFLVAEPGVASPEYHSQLRVNRKWKKELTLGSGALLWSSGRSWSAVLVLLESQSLSLNILPGVAHCLWSATRQVDLGELDIGKLVSSSSELADDLEHERVLRTVSLNSVAHP